MPPKAQRDASMLVGLLVSLAAFASADGVQVSSLINICSTRPHA